MIAIWLTVLIVGLWASNAGSRRVVTAGERLAMRFGLSPFMIGLTIIAIGTDMPEIATSISASASDHGDLVVGDSVGSTVTQITLVAGLLCLYRPMRAERRTVLWTGAMIVSALIIGAAVLNDQELGRVDGGLLVLFWLVGTYTVHAYAREPRSRQPELFSTTLASDVGQLTMALTAVAVGAMAVVLAFVEIADMLGVPEYLSSFFVLSIGTSLPELLVDGRALRDGQGALALGDLLGSSLVDATLSLGVGPLLFPVSVSASTAGGSLVAAGVVAGAVVVLARRQVHRRASGTALLGLYAIGFVLLLL